MGVAEDAARRIASTVRGAYRITSGSPRDYYAGLPPTPFAPGTVDPGAGIGKVVHALMYGRRMAEERARMREQEALYQKSLEAVEKKAQAAAYWDEPDPDTGIRRGDLSRESSEAAFRAPKAAPKQMVTVPGPNGEPGEIDFRTWYIRDSVERLTRQAAARKLTPDQIKELTDSAKALMGDWQKQVDIDAKLAFSPRRQQLEEDAKFISNADYKRLGPEEKRRYDNIIKHFGIPLDETTLKTMYGVERLNFAQNVQGKWLPAVLKKEFAAVADSVTAASKARRDRAGEILFNAALGGGGGGIDPAAQDLINRLDALTGPEDAEELAETP